MVEFAALQFPFSINIKFGHFMSKLCVRTVIRLYDDFYNRQLLKRINYTKHVERHLFKFTPRVVSMGARLFWFACNKNVIALLYFRTLN